MEYQSRVESREAVPCSNPYILLTQWSDKSSPLYTQVYSTVHMYTILLYCTHIDKSTLLYTCTHVYSTGHIYTTLLYCTHVHKSTLLYTYTQL